jgi:hypothetical protein
VGSFGFTQSVVSGQRTVLGSHAMPHWLAMQVALPPVGTGQAWPHVAQFSAEVVVSTQPASAPQYAVLASGPQ